MISERIVSDADQAKWRYRRFGLAYLSRALAADTYSLHSCGPPADKDKPILHEDPRLNKPDGQNIRELWADFLGAIKTGRGPVWDTPWEYPKA